ncbi:ABC-2 family transporter protein, partial [Candidatus Gottesmanbacteria bacterium]|nr:ABC-2 family transporter protein [Candidatus Gottesmanbacteria bacterium]
MENRFDFVLNIVRSTAWILIGILGFSILFGQANTIAGWNKHEALLLYGLFMFISELWYVLFFLNITRIPKYIQYGQFDYLLLLPVSLQFLVSLKEVLPFGLSNALFAMFIIVGQYAALGKSIGAGSLIVVALLVINGLVILYSIMFFIATLSFWFIRLHAIWEVYQTITEGARYPVDLFKDPLHFIFIFIIPLAVIFT